MRYRYLAGPCGVVVAPVVLPVASGAGGPDQRLFRCIQVGPVGEPVEVDAGGGQGPWFASVEVGFDAVPRVGAGFAHVEGCGAGVSEHVDAGG